MNMGNRIAKILQHNRCGFCSETLKEGSIYMPIRTPYDFVMATLCRVFGLPLAWCSKECYTLYMKQRKMEGE